MVFVISIDHKMKIKENEKIHKYLDIARELEKIEIEGVGDTNCSWPIGNSPKYVGEKRQEDLEIWGRIETIQATIIRPTRILGIDR